MSNSNNEMPRQSRKRKPRILNNNSPPINEVTVPHINEVTVNETHVNEEPSNLLENVNVDPVNTGRIDITRMPIKDLMDKPIITDHTQHKSIIIYLRVHGSIPCNINPNSLNNGTRRSKKRSKIPLILTDVVIPDKVEYLNKITFGCFGDNNFSTFNKANCAINNILESMKEHPDYQLIRHFRESYTKCFIPKGFDPRSYARGSKKAQYMSNLFGQGGLREFIYNRAGASMPLLHNKKYSFEYTDRQWRGMYVLHDDDNPEPYKMVLGGSYMTRVGEFSKMVFYTQDLLDELTSRGYTHISLIDTSCNACRVPRNTLKGKKLNKAIQKVKNSFSRGDLSGHF